MADQVTLKRILIYTGDEDWVKGVLAVSVVQPKIPFTTSSGTITEENRILTFPLPMPKKEA
jgi:hypothetical protein